MELIAPTSTDLIRAARQIIDDGGDPAPCSRGHFCLCCCLGIAKTEWDKQHGTSLDSYAALTTLIEMDFSGDHDRPLIEAVKMCSPHECTHHTKESALAVLDGVLAQSEPVST